MVVLTTMKLGSNPMMLSELLIRHRIEHFYVNTHREEIRKVVTPILAQIVMSFGVENLLEIDDNQTRS